MAIPVGELRRVEHPGDKYREAAREHFGPLQEGEELCYCPRCPGFFVASPYPKPCPDCNEYGTRVDTAAYYYCFKEPEE